MSSNEKSNEDLKSITDEIKKIKKEIHPDNIAKKIDSSYLSTGNLRIFLQILSVIMTIFVASSVGFGFLGVKNMLMLRDEIEKMNNLRSECEITLKELRSRRNYFAEEFKEEVNQARMAPYNALYNAFTRTYHDGEWANSREQLLLAQFMCSLRPSNSIANLCLAKALYDNNYISKSEIYLEKAKNCDDFGDDDNDIKLYNELTTKINLIKVSKGSNSNLNP